MLVAYTVLRLAARQLEVSMATHLAATTVGGTEPLMFSHHFLVALAPPTAAKFFSGTVSWTAGVHTISPACNVRICDKLWRMFHKVTCHPDMSSTTGHLMWHVNFYAIWPHDLPHEFKPIRHVAVTKCHTHSVPLCNMHNSVNKPITGLPCNHNHDQLVLVVGLGSGLVYLVLQ